MEEANNTVTTETNTPSETVEDVKQETETPITYSQEELDKAVKSASSRAKNDIMKELGITSVKDFSILKESYEKAIKETEELKTTNETLSNKLVLKGLDVNDDCADDFISLTKKRVTETKDFSTAAKEVAQLYPTMLKTSSVVETRKQFGNEKSETKSKDQGISEKLLEKYPHLRRK